MLDTIRQIGIFMIAAQAVVHFAPGRQYEKYIKSVSGIVILLLFLKPVLQFAGAAWEEPQALWEKWAGMTDMPVFGGTTGTDSAADEVVDRIESEVRERLNQELEGDVYFVSRVSIRFTQEPGLEAGTLLPEVEILMRERAGEKENGQIGIAEIVIGQPQESAPDETFVSYRKRFAALLEMEEENVEVRRDGRG